MQNRLTI
ncbi:unnamed protein product, partial [Allacma fusca]